MAVAVGDILEGVVTGITNFGAFVQLSDKESGLVHISEISHDYVEHISDHISKGDKVKVKVVSIDKDGKIGLSIRQTKPKSNTRPADIDWLKEDRQTNLSFEDKLNKFLKVSNEKIESVRQRNNNRSGGKTR
ncbi:MAG: S1 RNA-binding domain-containing protein [Tissierellia bacterium]|nr:S1 RNA-binding domain-containing protein [Tissierellia bacterium]